MTNSVQKKLRTARLLMISSMVILVLFQAYWLREVYKDEFNNLRRELSIVFRETAFKLQMQDMMPDSTAHRNRDSANQNHNNTVMRLSDTDSGSKIVIANRVAQPGTSITVSLPRESDSAGGRRSSRFFGFENNDNPDSVTRTLRFRYPVFRRIFENKELEKQYKLALQKNKLPDAFTIQKAKQAANDSARPGESAVRLNMFGGRRLQIEMVEVDFGPHARYIFPKMVWPILFAVLMLGIISLAFVFLYRNLREQHKLAALKNDFISNMTHELKTPIATVGVAIEALRNFSAIDNPERTREYLDISSAELNRLNMLIDKVLRLSMFEQDKLELQQTRVDLVQLSQQVITSLKLQSDKAGATVIFRPEQEAVWVTGDPLHLMSVLYNLVDNAIKYAPKVTITVSLQQAGQRIIWTVEDNGPGIAAEFQGRIFEKFFRVPKGDVHDVKGYGLGLSYVSEVVQQHGGTITLHSEPGKGCKFVVELAGQ